MGQKIASLEIELGMATGSAVADLNRFGGVVDKVTAQAIRDIDRIDTAMNNVGGLDAATAGTVKMAEATARSALEMAREADRSERAGERIVAQLERQASVYGLSRSEVRALRAEEAARAADAANQLELAGRIRAAQADLAGAELAAARAARFEAEAAAQDKEEAAQRAIAAAEREAQAMRQAAQGPAMFEAAAKRAWAAARELEAAEAAAARESASMADAAQRLRASIDPAYAAQMRFDQEMREARTLISAGAISLDDYVAKLRQQQAALDVATGAQARGAVNANAMRQATAGASYQVQDFVTQISMGANPINAFVVQGGQLAGQFMNVGGRAGAVAAFMMGPWGLAIQVGLMALGPLAAKLFESKETLNDLLKKKQEDADKSRLQARANEIWANSIDSVIERTRTLNGELVQQLRTRQQIDEDKLIDAQAQRGKNQAAFDSTLGALMAARAQLSSAITLRDTATDPRVRPAYAESADRVQRRVVELEREIGRVAGSLRVAESAVRAAEIAIDQRTVKAGLTAAGQATEQYETQLGALNERYRTGQITRERYVADLTTIEKAHQKATEAAREQARVTHDAEIATSASIAKMMRAAMPGVQITSTNGGQHVKGSDHYKGAAIDFVPAGGMDSMTKAQVREMFAAWGIAIKRNAAGVEQLFGPGDKGHSDHFHVAWEKGRLALDGYTDAMKRSKVEADKAKAVQRELDQNLEEVTRRFDPARYAAAQYAETLDKINALEMAGRITGADAMGYRQEAWDAETKRRAEAFAASARNILGIVGDPLKDILDEADAEQRNRLAARIDAQTEAAKRMTDQLDNMFSAADKAGAAMEHAFGRTGDAIGDAIGLLARYGQEQANLEKQRKDAAGDEQHLSDIQRQSGQLQLETTIGLIGATKGLFSERSRGYAAMEAAEKALTIVQLARTAIDVAGGAARMFASLGPLGFPAVAAMLGVMASLGFMGGGSGGSLPTSNTGTGTVLGDPDAQSASLRRGIDALKEVDLLTLTASREMAGHLRSIDSQIGGFAAQIVRAGDVSASANEGISEGFKKDLIGTFLSGMPLVGGFLSNLFGSKTTIVGGGLYGGAQTVGDIVSGGFDAQTYSDIEKKKKFLGITTGTKYSTQYGEADAGLENQFTLILRGFASAIGAAAGPLGEATDAVQARLNGFVVNIGKVDLKGLTGEQIQEKLEAIFGAAADGMAEAAFPGIARFQRAGEGLFETLVRVSSTVEAVDASFAMLGRGGIGIDASVALAGLFDNIGDLTNAQKAYFDGYYSEAEQAAARTAQMTRAIGSLGLAMPTSLAGFRALVEAQDLTSAAGREVYATLIQLAPAFAELQSSMGAAKSAADIAAERQDLERKLLELSGDQAAIRALDLAKLDASNRGLQEQVWAAEAAKEAAAKAEELRKAWSSVGDSIMDEVKRIRGISDAQGPAGFAALMGQFNAVTASARAGDMDAAKELPALSRSLLDAAAKAATSRQELDRVQAEAAASLEATYAAIAGFGDGGTAEDSASRTAEAMATAATAATNAVAATAGLVTEIRALKEEVAALRTENNAGHANTANEAGKSGKVLERAAAAAGGDVIGVRAVA